jgi:hypothetical protein
MKWLALPLLVLPAIVVPLSAESLRYSINWPSGLSLGEATLRSDRIREQGAEKGREQWDFDLSIDASVPGFVVRDHYHSQSSADFCSADLDKEYVHGKRKAQEHISFDQQKNTATRETKGGGKGDISVSPCARDVLTFLQFARRELAQGRLTPQQAVVFGAIYQVRVEFTGSQTVRVADERVEADHIVATIKGPSTDITVEMFFARDPARTPVLVKVPLALGAFSLELMK